MKNWYPWVSKSGDTRAQDRTIKHLSCLDKTDIFAICFLQRLGDDCSFMRTRHWLNYSVTILFGWDDLDDYFACMYVCILQFCRYGLQFCISSWIINQWYKLPGWNLFSTQRTFISSLQWLMNTLPTKYVSTQCASRIGSGFQA